MQELPRRGHFFRRSPGKSVDPFCQGRRLGLQGPGRDSQHQAGWEPGGCGEANSGEALDKHYHKGQAQDAESLGPKWYVVRSMGSELPWRSAHRNAKPYRNGIGHLRLNVNEKFPNANGPLDWRSVDQSMQG